MKAAATRRLAEAEARGLLERLGQPDPLADPVEELLTLGAETRSWLTVLRERVSELSKLDNTDRAGVERERALVGLYERALDRAHRLLADLAKLNLFERTVRLAESEAKALSELLEGVLVAPELALEDEQRQTFKQLLARRMRALVAGAES